MTLGPGVGTPGWTDEDMELLELLLERAALELASRKVMAGIWADRAAARGDAPETGHLAAG